MIRKSLQRVTDKTRGLAILSAGAGFLSAGAWVSFGLGAGLASIGLSLFALEWVSD